MTGVQTCALPIFLRHVSIPTQCEPRGAFLSYRNEVFYMIKKLPPCNRTRVNHYRFIPPLTHTNIRVPFNGGKPASLTFLSQSKISGSNSGVIFFCFYSHRASTIPDSLSLSTTKYCLHHRFYLALL